MHVTARVAAAASVQVFVLAAAALRRPAVVTQVQIVIVLTSRVIGSALFALPRLAFLTPRAIAGMRKLLGAVEIHGVSFETAGAHASHLQVFGHTVHSPRGSSCSWHTSHKLPRPHLRHA